MKFVTLPESVRRIGDGAFDYCLALEDIHVPEGLEEIDREAFALVSQITYHGKLMSERNWGAKSRNGPKMPFC